MRWLAPLLCLCACSGGGGGSAGGPSPPPPSAPAGAPAVQVSGLSPFVPGCGGTGGTLYVNAEVEPHLAVDPRDANHLVAAWQQDRWSDGAARGLLAAVSFDGGTTWAASMPAFCVCAGGTAAAHGDFLRASDPWLSFGADGSVYLVAIALTGATFAPGSVNTVAVARSTDGGRSWSAPALLIRDLADHFDDKPTVTADPLDARYAYATWDRLARSGGGPAYLARSSDGGATWEPARAIYDPGSGAQTIGNLVRVLPDGTLVNLATRLTGDENTVSDSALEVVRSHDHGATWSAPVRVAAYQPLGVRDPATGQPIRDGVPVAQMAVAPDGTLVVAWQDGRFTGLRDAIALSRSLDGGLTWSAPVRVNADAAVAAFTPQVHVAGDGTIGVSYFDLRPDTADPATLLVEHWLARSVDGVTWTETLVAGPFDLLVAPRASGAPFLGDYTGLGAAGSTFLPLYARTTGTAADRTNVHLARVGPAAKRAAYRAGGPPAARPPGFAAAVAANLARTLASRRARWASPSPAPRRAP